MRQLQSRQIRPRHEGLDALQAHLISPTCIVISIKPSLCLIQGGGPFNLYSTDMEGIFRQEPSDTFAQMLQHTTVFGMKPPDKVLCHLADA